MAFECSAWNNGQHRESGAGYGLKIPIAERDKYFERTWKFVTLQLPMSSGLIEVRVNIDKPSFWNETCHEVISKELGAWLRSAGHAPWPRGRPPKFLAEPSGEQRFLIRHTDA